MELQFLAPEKGGICGNRRNLMSQITDLLKTPNSVSRRIYWLGADAVKTISGNQKHAPLWCHSIAPSPSREFHWGQLPVVEVKESQTLKDHPTYHSNEMPHMPLPYKSPKILVPDQKAEECNRNPS